MKKILLVTIKRINILLREVKAFFDSIFFKNRLVLSSLVTGIILSSVIFVTLIIKVEPVDFLVPTKFNSFFGVSKLGSWFELYNLFFLSCFIFLLNTFLAYKLFLKERLVSYFLAISIIFLDILILIETLGFVVLLGK